MAIIGTLPVTLVNGTTADATQVMSDLNFISSQVNSGAAALAGGNAFTGTQTIGGDTIVTLGATQNLTNKTINGDTPVTLTATQTLSNKSFATPFGIGTASPAADCEVKTIPASSTITFLYVTNGQSSVSGQIAASGSTFSIPGFGPSSVYFGTPNGNTNVTFGNVNAGSGQVMVAANGATRFTFMPDGRIFGSGLHNNANPVTGTANQYIASGTYTPTSGGSASNIASVTFSPCAWMRVGNVVTVSGSIRIQASAAANTFTFQDFTIPIASTLSSLSSLGGSATGASGGVASFASMGPDTANNTCQIYFLATSVVAQVFTFSFQYLIS